ncbi:MAG TPA: hypothetical protein VHT29_05100, partial [Solirubrobacteraceae bacterium]|nr:hypothetical protein [Solirubrobacteraceae bacterium]
MLHRELYYLSERLAADLAHQAAASKKPKLRPTVTAAVPGLPFGVSLTSASTSAKPTNRHVLANEALRAATDEVGSLADPGRYILLADFPFSMWVFSFKAEPKKPIAVVLCKSLLEKSVMVLVGRASNV